MKTFCIAITISLLFLSICFEAYPQARKVWFEHHSLEKGLKNIPIENLLQVSVENLLQDNKGYLWFSIRDGLVKYDGYNFISYKHIPQDTTSLIGNTIFSLWEDKERIIWIGTAEAGITKFDRKTGEFSQYQPEPDPTTFVPPFRAVSAINEDSEGFLWAANYLGELRRFNKHTNTFFSQKYDLGYRKESDTIKAYNNIFLHLQRPLWHPLDWGHGRFT